MTQKENYLKTIILLFIAICLSIVRIPEILVWIWPNWLLVLLLFLFIVKPGKYNIFFALILGIISDLLIGNTLGLHAASYSFIGYILLKLQHRIAFFHLVQQLLLVFLLVLTDNLLIAVFNKLFGLYLIYSVTSAVVTTVVWLILIKFFGKNNKLSSII